MLGALAVTQFLWTRVSQSGSVFLSSLNNFTFPPKHFHYILVYLFMQCLSPYHVQDIGPGMGQKIQQIRSQLLNLNTGSVSHT